GRGVHEDDATGRPSSPRDTCDGKNRLTKGIDPLAQSMTAGRVQPLAETIEKVVAPAQMDGQGSRGEQFGKLRAEREAKAIMPGKLRAEREAKAIMKLAGRDKSQWCNLHMIG
ncbi:hypothetical protein THAOC_12685, partial [Thalassiosira oceanica]